MTSSERSKQWRDEHPEYWKIKNEQRKKKYAEDPEHRHMVLRRAALSRHKMTIEQYATQLAEQHGVCALCGQPPQNNSLHVDHNHECCDTKFTCGKCNRGLLCSHCNIMIGYLERVLKDALVFPMLGKDQSWTGRALRYLIDWEYKRKTQKETQ